MKRLIALLLIFSIICLYGNMYAKERRGAELVIQKIDGLKVKGELIAVKRNSLLLKEAESGADWAVGVAEIKTITIVKKSKFWKGAGYGLLMGALTGAVIGLCARSGDISSGGAAGVGAAFFGGTGVLIGGIIGASSGKDKTILIEGMPPETIESHLETLRKKARVPNFQ